jgi:hypothetical protein
MKNMKLPDLLIVADYDSLSAYVILPDGLPEIADHIDYEHDGQTGVPLVGWSGGREGYRAVAEQIARILNRYQPRSWGLASPPLLGRKITEWLSADQRASLAALRQTDVENIEISNVVKVFDPAAKDYHSEKEHC